MAVNSSWSAVLANSNELLESVVVETTVESFCRLRLIHSLHMNQKIGACVWAPIQSRVALVHSQWLKRVREA